MACPAPVSAVAPHRDDIVLILLLRQAIVRKLRADIAGSAKLGDWIEARVDIQKIGRTLAFANAYLYVDEARIARVSGVFVVQRPPREKP